MSKPSAHLPLVVLAVLAVLAAAGCAPKASDMLPKIKTGMNTEEVREALGKPQVTHCVHFQGNEGNYLVWEYEMVPDMPVCPSEGISRVATGIVTLGLSEVAWSHAKAKPYWLYFHENTLMHFAPAFDCSAQKFCTMVKLNGTKGCQ